MTYKELIKLISESKYPYLSEDLPIKVSLNRNDNLTVVNAKITYDHELVLTIGEKESLFLESQELGNGF